MSNCQHLLGIFYCIEVDPELSLDMGKVVFFSKPPLAITMCCLCNEVFDSASTAPPDEEAIRQGIAS